MANLTNSANLINKVESLETSVNSKANDNAVVKLTGDQTVAGTKTFSTSPVVPSKTTDAANTGTAIATEAQVYKKADASDVLTKTNTTSFTPDGDYQPATKKYVDDSVSGKEGTLTEITKSDMDTGTSTTAGKVAAKSIADYVKGKISSVYKYKGSKANYDALPSSGNEIGDVWNVEAAHTTAPIFPAGSNVAWDGSAWDVLGGTVDLSNYLAKDNTTAFTPTGNYNPATKKYVDDGLSGKQSTLSTQTAYTSKGTATKVPQITTNTLGQVTGITEVDIQAGETYNAGNGISIGDILINGRQGPCPEGWHVPETTEWQGVKSIMDELYLTTGDSWRIKLHLPFAGYRSYSSASLDLQGDVGNYWSSSPYGSDYPYYARYLYLNSYIVDANNSSYRANGYSVRCFKDSYVAPDEGGSWTAIDARYDEFGHWARGIFWNQSEGIISITGDMTSGYTIMDKNLGATTVYSDGDTLTQANMGNMYQWGNNYGFPSTGTISNTSSTQVDASSYGPTNPYLSDTFITGNDDWSSVHNDDLWGNTTGTITQENVISNTGVLSVNGETGDVTLDADDISDSTTTNKFVTATDKSTWSGKQDALTLPATPTQGNLVTWGANNKTLVDGGAVPTGVPSGGNNGDVLTNVSGTPTWAAPAATGITNDTTGTTTTVEKIWAGNATEYANVTKVEGVIYHVYE